MKPWLYQDVEPRLLATSADSEDHAYGGTPCREWQKSLRNGYGHLSICGKEAYAHRAAYELWVGPIPAGMQIDHLCRNPRCINPLHLEPVVPKENLRRSPIVPTSINALKTHCNRGHEFNDRNTRIERLRDGGTCRRCLICRRESDAVRHGRKVHGDLRGEEG